MARRSSKLTTAEKIEKLEGEISAMEEELKALKSQKKELEEQKKKEDLNELYSIITESGKSIDEVKSMILGE